MLNDGVNLGTNLWGRPMMNMYCQLAERAEAIISSGAS